MTDLCNPFNTREMATGIWIVIGLGWALSRATVRTSMLALLRSVFNPYLSTLVLLTWIYVAVLVFLLKLVGFWSTEFLKDSILWSLCSGLFLLFRQIDSQDHRTIFSSVAKDNLKLIVVLQFLTNTYTFHLAIELLLVPFWTILGMLNAFAQFYERYKPVRTFLSLFIILPSFMVIVYAAWRGLSDLQNFATTVTLRKFLLTPLLALALTPWVFLTQLYMAYESASVSLRVGNPKARSLRRYIKWRLIKHFGLKLGPLQRFNNSNSFRLSHIQTKEEVENILNNL